MSWETYRRRLLAANPALGEPERRMTITSASLLSQLEKAYRQAVADFLDDGKECNGKANMPDFMRDFFGDFMK